MASLAIIGSFRRHYAEVLQAVGEARRLGWTVRSPLGGSVLDPGAEFVRFDSDRPDYDDPQVQSVALHRILGADLVFVVAPDGYVGRTTCYEIGRIVQADVPLYFSQMPRDLPIYVPPDGVAALSDLSSAVAHGSLRPWWGRGNTPADEWERRLQAGDYADV